MSVDNIHILWWFLIFSYVCAQDPVANLPQGRIVGIKVYTKNSLTPVEIFFGIPYATPPTGRYRFSAPERHSGWRRTFFAHRMPPRCPQLADSENENISEDCLYLNIWTPRRADGKSLPVAVILYSESWARSRVTLPCQELAAEGVVVVTVSYRLHMLSFFALRSIAARGNLALLDQYMALLWVRDNIAAFGGDPTTITLIGHSAGADSVLYHIASPRTLGLFQRAVLMSPKDIWKTLDKDLVNANATERISLDMARTLGCNSDIDQEIVHCLRSRSLTDIVSLYSKVNWTNGMQPILDNFLPETEQYLPAPFPLALSAGKRPMQLDLLLGTTDLEAINNSDEDYEELLKRGVSYVSEYTNAKAIPDLLQMFSLHRSEVLPMLSQAVRWEYWGVKARNNAEMEALEAVESLARMQSSARWGAGAALLAARLARRVTRLYVYRYTDPAGVDLRGRQVNFTGAVHGSDLLALLGDALMLQVARRPATEEEKQISTLFRRYIANFIKFGSPAVNEEWQLYRAGDARVHDIRGDRGAYPAQTASREAAFWLQYLPQLSNLLTSPEHTEQLTSDNGDNRLRGGVFAMCGVSVALILLLLVCAILLHKERAHRSSIADNSHL